MEAVWDCFFIATAGNPTKSCFNSIVDVTKSKHYNGLGRYISRGYDTYGLFKLVGGLQKGNPTEEEIKRAVDFYKNLL